jgi:hypothetical protein
MSIAEKAVGVVEIPSTVGYVMIDLPGDASLEIAEEPVESRGKWLFVGTERMPVPGLLLRGGDGEFDKELDYENTLLRVRRNEQPEPAGEVTLSDQIYSMANAGMPKALLLTTQDEAGRPAIRHFEIRSGSGRIALKRLTNAEVTIRSDSGSIEATDLQMRSLKIKTGLNGEIVLNNVESGDLSAETSRGRIEVTGGGNTSSRRSRSGGWSLASYDGDITYRQTPSGVIVARSNLGKITTVNPV